MIIEIGSDKLFMGFYESVFCNSDKFIDDENEILSEIKDVMGDDKNISVECDIENFDEYKKDVCTLFMNKYVERINDELPYDIRDDKCFKFEIVDKENNIIVSSPKFYNYRTDKCYCDVETNYKTLQLIKDYTLNLNGVNDYIKRNFTSCDGFISFVSNDLDYWKSLDIKEYKENMIIALLDMLLCLSDDDIRFKLNSDVYYDVETWSYVVTYVYYDNKKYELNEFNKKFNIK